MKQILTDDEVSIPHEAVEYINDKLSRSEAEPFTFEVIEAFFEWLSIQPLQAQRRILRKVMTHGRAAVEICSRFREKVY